MKDLKYLAALSMPVMAFLGIYFKGFFVFLTPFYAFVLLPALDLLCPMDPSNLSSEEVTNKLKNRLFDWLLYLNVLVVYGLVLYALTRVSTNSLELFEVIGLVFSIGIVLAVNGINVAHELGHRQSSNERFLGKALLLPSFYMHFYIIYMPQLLKILQLQDTIKRFILFGLHLPLDNISIHGKFKTHY